MYSFEAEDESGYSNEILPLDNQDQAIELRSIARFHIEIKVVEYCNYNPLPVVRYS